MMVVMPKVFLLHVCDILNMWVYLWALAARQFSASFLSEQKQYMYHICNVLVWGTQ